MLKEISLVIFIIFNISLFFSFLKQKEAHFNKIESSQNTFFENSDSHSKTIYQKNDFDTTTKIVYLY